jgi:mono/diheme cytochrome c family protein
MRRGSAALAIVAAIAASGVAHAGSAARGGLLVTEACSACHATGRTGASRNPDAPPFRELGRRYPIEDLEEALAEGIVTGHAEMPQFRFDAADVDDIVAYLKSIQVPAPAPAAHPASAPRGVSRK